MDKSNFRRSLLYFATFAAIHYVLKPTPAHSVLGDFLGWSAYPEGLRLMMAFVSLIATSLVFGAMEYRELMSVDVALRYLRSRFAASTR